MFSYSSVLRACDGSLNLRRLHCSIVKVRFDSDVFVQSAIIDVYAKLGDSENALAVFNEMLTGDLVVWNSIIGGFAQNTHVHVTKSGRDLILDNVLLDMYCKCGSLDTAKFAFDGMMERDLISWSTMVAGLAQWLQQRSSSLPNYITILGVLFACSHAGLVDDGWYYFRSMKKLPQREHCGCMVDLLGRAGKLEEAVNLTRELECEPDIVPMRTLLGACKVHRNLKSLLAIPSSEKLKDPLKDEIVMGSVIE
ncbi:Pentatricopeptide repeat [Dillenia turbinata]|uniref:Pentatricopeptide repeat n=1 Tax=Dillenia turbinata TaxID=194707 RepID=A0AAN8ZKT3_9MAGN